MAEETGAYKPKRGIWNLGFDSGYIAHPRSRWAGNSYWLMAGAEGAVPKMVREKRETKPYSPKQIKSKIAPLLAPWEEGKVIEIAEFGEPQPYRAGTYVRTMRPAGILAASRLCLVVNADFLAHIEKNLPMPGTWFLTLRGHLVNAHLKAPQALLMPVLVGSALYDDSEAGR